VTRVDRFRPGDRVRVLDVAPEGNPRTPRYLRGWTGTVATCHGVVENPLDHQRAYPPLYTVVFPMPGDREPHDEVVADIHEEWLVAAEDPPTAG
jgi:hypothetical protein